AIATIALIVISITGLYLYLPFMRRNFYSSLKIDFRKKGRGFLYKLHSVFGVWTLIFVLLMSLTGLWWSYDWYRNGIYWLAGVEPTQRGFQPQGQQGQGQTQGQGQGQTQGQGQVQGQLQMQGQGQTQGQLQTQPSAGNQGGSVTANMEGRGEARGANAESRGANAEGRGETRGTGEARGDRNAFNAENRGNPNTAINAESRGETRGANAESRGANAEGRGEARGSGVTANSEGRGETRGAGGEARGANATAQPIATGETRGAIATDGARTQPSAQQQPPAPRTSEDYLAAAKAYDLFKQTVGEDYRSVTITLPQAGARLFSLNYIEQNPAHSRASNQLQLDTDKNEIVKHARYDDRTLGEKFIGSIFPLHSGDFFGVVGLALYCVSSFAMALFAITGYMLYYERFVRERKRKRNKREQDDDNEPSAQVVVSPAARGEFGEA
ncbi:MAG: PepSY domain-containing protein, partial [Helicobacteraceae bacterium]|nr:PepSY domain-containing protein [Helicobacteraceae bacterium]